MNVDLVRWIDYWIGIPLTIVFSVVDSIRSRLFPIRNHHSKRILFIELSEMGSAIIAHSAMSRAIELVGRENVFFLIFSRNRESVDLLDVIDKSQVILIDDSNFFSFVTSTFCALFETWRLRIDTSIDLELFSRFTALFSYATRSVVRVGFHRFTNEGLFRGTFINKAVLYNNHQHMALNFLALVDAAFSHTTEIPHTKKDVSGELIELPRLQISEDGKSRAEKWLEPLRRCCGKIVVLNPHPGMLLPIRGWPLDHFVNLTQLIVKENPDWGVAVVGLPEAKQFSQAICASASPERVIDLTGVTESLLDLLAVLEQTDLFITNDSGPAHFSSLVRVKSIVFFGPETSRLYGPLHREAVSLSSNVACSPCFSAYNHRTTACTNNRCLQEIKPEEVVRVAKGMVIGLNIIS